MAWRSDDPAGDCDHRSDRPRIWPRRAPAPARASLLVPVLRRGDGNGLAFLRDHDERARRAEARPDAALRRTRHPRLRRGDRFPSFLFTQVRSSSHWTHRWREKDSNPRSPARETTLRDCLFSIRLTNAVLTIFRRGRWTAGWGTRSGASFCPLRPLGEFPGGVPTRQVQFLKL